MDPLRLLHAPCSPRSADSLREAPAMDRRTFLAGTGAVLLASPFAAEAQPAGKVPRVGFLTAFSASDVPQWREGFRQGLRDFGYTEGRNIVIEYRYAEGRPERLPGLAAELVRLKMDIIA